MGDSVTSALAGLGGGTASGSATAASAGGTGVGKKDNGPLVLVPAGFIADIAAGLAGTVGELTGGYFGNAPLGRKIGEASEPLIRLLPFQIIAPEVAPASAGPDTASGHDEALIVVPAGFLGGILGGIGGKLLGGQVDKWLGGSGKTGSSVGSTLGSVVGGLIPFQVVPPALMPASTGPGGGEPQEPLVVVPAGFFGNLVGSVAGTFGELVGGKTGRKIGDAAAPFIKRLVPFQDVPPQIAPQSAGPGGEAVEERLIVVPAGFFSSIVGGLAETIGGEVGGWFGDSDTGATIGGAAGSIIEMLPFHAVPPTLAPASVGPTGEEDPAQKLMFVPAGLFGNLLSGLSGAVGGTVGKWAGSESTGKAIGDAASPFLKMLPFQVVAPAGVAGD